MEYSDVMQCRVICVFIQKNWDKWKSILKINDVTTFLLCILHKFKKYKEKGCILYGRLKRKNIVDKSDSAMYNCLGVKRRQT